MKVTRDVIVDLWPLYESGEASADTRALVDDFCAAHPEFADMLRAPTRLDSSPVAVAPDTEVAALKRTRDLVRGAAWLRGLRLVATVLTIFTFGRIIADTTWTVSPRAFIADAVMATICWSAYAALLRRYRRNALRIQVTSTPRAPRR